MMNLKRNLLFMIVLSVFIFGVTELLPLPVWAQTYTATMHGTSANRSAVEATFPYTTNGLCAHCHDQHASIAGAEPTLPSAQGPSYYSLFQDNYGSDTNDLCYACHDTFTISGMTLGYGQYGIYQGSIKYDASIHSTSASMDWSPDSSPPGPPFGPSSNLTDPGNCHNCHNPHGYDDGSGLVPYMLFARDSQTGDSPAYEMGCEACHDGTQGGAFKDVQAQLNKTYAHPTHDYNDRHTLPESGSASFGPANRHAECVDCHNPHTVVSGTNHVAGTTGNAVSDVLKYVWGVQPTWTSIWTQPTSFTVRKPATYNDGAQYEYQICFKCHTRYGLGADTDGTANDGIYPSISPATTGGTVTDQAMEFNINNKSAHPVVVGLDNLTGSYNPDNINSNAMNSPWTSVGTQTMYCSDCHGANDEHSTGAKGPHGSSRAFMLKDATDGSNVYWPAGSGGKLFSLNDIAGSDSAENPYRGLNSNWSTELFCLNCHDVFPSSDKNTWRHEAHSKHDDRNYEPTPDGNRHNVYCIACHSVVPHGNKRSRMIAYESEPAPYTYRSGGVNYNIIVGFKKTTVNNYDKDNCWSSDNRCENKHPDQGGNVGGYDP